MRQFFLSLPSAQAAAPGAVVGLDDDESHHLQTVLRGGREQTLALTDGRGRRYTAKAAPGAGRIASVEILTCEVDRAELAAPRLALAWPWSRAGASNGSWRRPSSWGPI